MDYVKSLLVDKDDENKRFFDGDYLRVVRFLKGEMYPVDKLNVIDILPVDDSFKAEKKFHYETDNKNRWLSHYGFFAANIFQMAERCGS